MLFLGPFGVSGKIKLKVMKKTLLFLGCCVLPADLSATFMLLRFTCGFIRDLHVAAFYLRIYPRPA
jgi:hypothetical protein